MVNRMIRVLYLLADNLNHTVDEIADKAQTCPRTVYRYLQAFKDAGLKVICRYGSVYKIEKWWNLCNDKEPARHKTDSKDKERGIVLQRPLQDLKCPDGTYELLEQFNDKGFLKDMPYLQKCVANVDLMVKAASLHKKILLKNYASNEWNRLCDRIIEPYDFPFYYNFVWAYDCELKRNILLRGSRTEEVKILDEDWDWEEQHRKQNMDAWGCYGWRTYPITLRVSMKVRNLMEEAYPMSMIEMKPDKTAKKGRHWILSTQVCDFSGVGQFIMGLLDEVEILEGEGLREYLRKRRLELLRVEI
jgi:predicted DNA-binding transcriptional regulator YafY